MLEEQQVPAWARGLSSFIHRRFRLVLAVAVVFAVLSTMAATRLRIDQELRRLLPSTFPSVTRLDRLQARAGQQSDLYVTIRSPSREANVAYGDAVVEALQGRDDLRYVVFRRDLSYFDEHALLYASLGDLLDLRLRVIAKIREEVGKQAFGDFSDDGDKPQAGGKEDADALGFDADEMRERYGVSEASQEYMEADEGRLMVVKMRPIRPATDLEFAETLTQDVQRIAEELDPHSFHHEMEFELNGSYVQHQQRLKSVQNEVWGGSIAAVLALLVTLGIYFRSPRGVALVMVPLLVSVVGALAFGWLAFGVLNLVSAFIFAVLLGLGIDFGIHVLARLRQERGRGLSSQGALALCLATSGKTTAAGAASTALAFAALSIADFQGFAQFGQVAAVGVVLSVLGAVVLMPALVVAFDRVRPWNPPAPSERGDGLGKWGRGLSVVAMLMVAGGTLAAIWGGMHLSELEYEHDLKKLGPVRPKSDGPPRAGYRDAVGKAQTVDPAVVLVDTPEQALAVQRQLDALLEMTPEELAAFDPASPPTRALPEPPETLDSGIEALEEDEDWDADEDDGEWDDDDEGWDDEDKDLDDPVFKALEVLAVSDAVMSSDTAALLGKYELERLRIMRQRLAKVWSVHAFVPRQQTEKLEVIADIRTRIDAKKASMSAKSKAQIDEWYPYLSVSGPVEVEALPGWVTGQFEDTSGDASRFVIVATKGSKANIENSREIYRAYASLHTDAGEVDLAADFFVIPEIFDAIDADGPRVMAVSVAVMLLTAFVLLRNVWGVLGVTITVGFSLMWLAGLFVGLGWKLNFFNIIVLPLLLGMGQDDALHLVERHREEVERTGKGNLGRVLREAGGAIFITTITTVWGFSGILFANHRGLESMAWAAVLGMVLALVASVLVLPFLLQIGLEIGHRLRKP